MIIFETPRLIVREYTKEDADNFFELNSNEKIVRYIRPAKNRKESDDFLSENINSYQQHPHLGRWAVIEKETKQFIGSFALIAVENIIDQLQVGYALLPSAWGKGFATELVNYGKPYFFAHHARDILYALTEQPNIASQKTLLKCGFRMDEIIMEGQKEILIFSINRETFG